MYTPNEQQITNSEQRNSADKHSQPKPRKALIYERAAISFRDRGFLATTMRQLAEDVGLEVSSLYSHIKSKDELLSAICLQCADRFTSRIIDIRKSKKTAVEKLRAVIWLHAQIANEDPTSITVFNDEWRHLYGEKLEQFSKLRKRYENEFSKIIKEGISTGELRNLNARILQSTFLSALQWMHRSSSFQRKNVDHIVNDISDMLLTGITNHAR